MLITQEEIDNALISIIGKELKPMTPVEKSIVGMRRLLLGITDELRMAKRESLLDVTPEDLMDFAAVLIHCFDSASTVILSSRESLIHASEDLPGLMENLTELPT